MMAAYTCDMCGHMMLDDQLREEAKYTILKAQLRKHIERMERNGYSGVETGRVTAKEVLDFWIPQLKSILGGE